MEKDSVADQIVQYATDQNITRIVMGQTKRTRWEEIVYGSIINKILRKTRNIDVFIVADRTEKDVERVIPTKQRRKEEATNPFRRLTMQELENELDKVRRGTLKVYIGAAPGVGTFLTRPSMVLFNPAHPHLECFLRV